MRTFQWIQNAPACIHPTFIIQQHPTQLLHANRWSCRHEQPRLRSIFNRWLSLFKAAIAYQINRPRGNNAKDPRRQISLLCTKPCCYQLLWFTSPKKRASNYFPFQDFLSRLSTVIFTEYLRYKPFAMTRAALTHWLCDSHSDTENFLIIPTSEPKQHRSFHQFSNRKPAVDSGDAISIVNRFAQ